jgi:hypothetical protein
LYKEIRPFEATFSKVPYRLSHRTTPAGSYWQVVVARGLGNGDYPAFILEKLKGFWRKKFVVPLLSTVKKTLKQKAFWKFVKTAFAVVTDGWIHAVFVPKHLVRLC